MKSCGAEAGGMKRFVLAAVLLLPLATAHDAGPAQYQQQMWDDGAFLEALPQDGYDLRSLIAWEAYQEEAGLMVHWHMVGGDVSGAYDMHQIDLNITIGNTSTVLSWSSLDHANWTGDLPITVASEEGEGAIPMTTQWRHAAQAFIPLSAIEASIGDDLSGFHMESLAHRGTNVSRVDLAPGGYFALGAPVELPEPRLDGSVDADSHSSTTTTEPSMFLQGPGRHLGASGSWDGGTVAIQVINPYNAAWQNVTMHAPSAAEAQEGQDVALGPGMQASFHYDVPLADAAKDWVWEVSSDIGGHAQLSVRLPAADQPPPDPVIIDRTDEQADPPTDDGDDSDGGDDRDGEDGSGKGKDSPAGLWIGLVALGAVLWIRRR